MVPFSSSDGAARRARDGGGAGPARKPFARFHVAPILELRTLDGSGRGRNSSARTNADVGSLTTMPPQERSSDVETGDGEEIWLDVAPVPGTFMVNLRYQRER